MKPKTVVVAMALCLSAIIGTNASAQEPEYPQRLVRLIVGLAAGGGTDEMARTVARYLSDKLGQQVIVENRPGAGTLLAAEHVAKAPADGYTLLFGGTSMLVAHMLQTKAGRPSQFDPLSSLDPVAVVGTAPLTLSASLSFPADDPKGFVEEVKANPDKYFYATAGVGSLQHLAVEMLSQSLELKMQHIPYKGGSQVLPDLISGNVPLASLSASTAQGPAQSNRIKVIGLLSADKLSTQPQWANMAEVLPGFDVMPRLYLMAPAGTPPKVIEKLESSLQQVLAMDEIAKSFSQQSSEPAFAPAVALKAELQRESQQWGEAIGLLNLQTN